GQVGNIEHELVRVGKAGRSRWLGRRPTVRGTVMNAEDHPHGGGEGRTPIVMPSPVSPWGQPTIGYKTRKRNKPSNKYIVRERKRYLNQRRSIRAAHSERRFIHGLQFKKGTSCR